MAADFLAVAEAAVAVGADLVVVLLVVAERGEAGRVISEFFSVKNDNLKCIFDL